MTAAASPSMIERLRAAIGNASVHRKLAFALVIAAVISVIATVATMTGQSSAVADVQTILNLVYLDGILLLLLGLVVAQKLVSVWQERRRGQAGAGLHVRLVMLFGLVAVTPAVLVAVFSALFINYGLQTWFNKRISTAINQSQVVANAYLQEHRKNISTDAYAIAGDLNFNAPLLAGDIRQLSRILSHHAALRSLSEVLIVDRRGNVLSRSELSLSTKAGRLPDGVLAQADQGEIAVFGGKKDLRMRALIRLQSFSEGYLLIERFIDPQVVEHINRIETAVSRYQAMEKERSGIQISFVMIFVIVSVLLLMAAIWIGLTVSTQLAQPISSLISAAERVSAGDLSVSVETTDSDDEISNLSRAFNAMTSDLKSSQEGLMEANQELDERRRFTETVLAGVSAGVIGLNADARIHLPNRSASELLSTDLAAYVGKPLGDAVPEMVPLLETVIARPQRSRQEEIKIVRDDRQRTLVVSIAAERLENQVIGFVVTFDDVTDLFSAQRMAAWADVARRIAHEIKNPLTPIQLSAERLNRKYLDQITDDPETFATCTETIVRQVEELHRMVDEFSAFARMPELSLRDENLSDICRGVVTLESNRQPEIEYASNAPDEDVRLYCDRRQVSRALTNLLKNAAESITQAGVKDGRIGVTIEGSRGGKSDDDGAGIITVTVADNGGGLPKEFRDSLTEPYVTTRAKGTGLGLAIVKKIMEDHHGTLTLEDRDGGGARIVLAFRPMDRADDAPGAASGEDDAMRVATGLSAHGS